jgi:molybdate transport system permease protein
MIGGNIPGQTQVASISIYNYVETLDYESAHTLSALLLAISFTLLMLIYAIKNKLR